MQHPEQRISTEARALLSEIGKSPQPGLDPVTFDALAADVWRSGGDALPGTHVTWKLVQNTDWCTAAALAYVCTDPAVITQIAKREKRRPVLNRLLDNANFPADTAQELLHHTKFHNDDLYDRMLYHSKLHDRQVQRFVNGVAASKSMTVETVIVGLQTTDLFGVELHRRLADGDTDLMILVYETLSESAARPFPALSPDLRRELCAVIPTENVPFGQKLVKYLLSDPSHVGFSGSLPIPQVDDNAIRYLQHQEILEHSEDYRPGSTHLTLRQALESRCRDSELGNHDTQLDNWCGGQSALVELLFSSDPAIQKAALRTCLKPSYDYYRPFVETYNSRIETYLLRGELRGWAGMCTAAWPCVEPGLSRRKQPRVSGQVTDAVLARHRDLDEVFEHLMVCDPSTTYTDNPDVAHADGEILSLIPIILRSVGGRFTNERFVALVNRYGQGTGFEVELHALLSTMKDRSIYLQIQALLLGAVADALDAWFDGEYWGEPTAQDASKLIDEVSNRDRTSRTARNIGRALLLGGMSSEPYMTLTAINDDPFVTREFLRRYEQAEGFNACALLVATTPATNLSDWLEVQPRTIADITAVTDVWCGHSWLSEPQAVQLITASGGDVTVLERLVRSSLPHLSKAALNTQKLPTPLAVTALSHCEDDVFVNWVSGTQHGPALTEQNITAVLTATSLREPAILSSIRSVSGRRALLAGNELVARGFSSILDTTAGVPRELLNLTHELNKYSYQLSVPSGRVCEYALDTMVGLLNFAGESLGRYLLETLATWEGSFDELRALILAVRPD